MFAPFEGVILQILSGIILFHLYFLIFSSTFVQGTYSTQIFSLAVLLSSMFVYNQVGAINEGP